MISPATVPSGAVRRATDDVARYRLDPCALPDLSIGRFSDAGVRSLLLRRMLLRIPIPAILVERLAFAAPRGPGKKVAELAAEASYWRTARSLLLPDEWASLIHGPVILMYHAIGMAGEKASRYIIPRQQFERQVAWLKARGYRLMTLRQLAEARSTGLPQPRAVALTFDDGYTDNADALLSLGIPATVAAVTGAVGATNEWDGAGLLRGRKLLSWDELRSLRAAGIEIGGHSRTHPSLPDLPASRLHEEVRESLADLHRELGAGHYTFAYPHGRFNNETQEALAAAHCGDGTRYVAAACSRGGVNDPYVSPYELRRVEVKGTDSLRSFALMVALGRRITPSQLLRSLLTGG